MKYFSLITFLVTSAKLNRLMFVKVLANPRLDVFCFYTMYTVAVIIVDISTFIHARQIH